MTRLRWVSYRDRDKGRDGASLIIDGRYVGGVIRYSDRRGWHGSAFGRRVGPFDRRCDAKRAVEVAAVAEVRA